MAIAPIAGMLKKHLLTHLSIGIGGGAVAGYAWWSVLASSSPRPPPQNLDPPPTTSEAPYTFHVPKVQNRDAWYLEYSKQKQ
ncbi:hypothetical protein JCM8097_002537 [Rhodosporidiobolus ruineniae]